MTHPVNYPPPAPLEPLDIHGVPWLHVYVSPGIYDRIRVLSRRQARRRDRAKAKARKHATPAWRRRHNRRQVVLMLGLIGLIFLGLVKAPADPFHKAPVPGPAVVQPATQPVQP